MCIESKILEEKEEQMRLAIEERELIKMATVSKQDTETQNLLSELDEQLALARGEAESMEKKMQEQNQKYQHELEELQKEMNVRKHNNIIK